MPAEHSFLGLPAEIRLTTCIYELVLYRPCKKTGGPNNKLRYHNTKQALYDVDSGIIGVNKQVYDESIDIAFKCNTFEWAGQAIKHYPPLLRSRLHSIRTISFDIDAFRIHSLRWYPGFEDDYMSDNFPKHLRKIIINIQTVNHKFKANLQQLRDFLIDEDSWRPCIHAITKNTKIQIDIVRYGPRIDIFEEILRKEFPRHIIDRTDPIITTEASVEAIDS